MQGRQIDVRKGMPSFASIPVTIRTLFKTNRPGDGGGSGPTLPPRRSRGKIKVVVNNFRTKTG